jgi:endonuclease YncB( thermonuclease family)
MVHRCEETGLSSDDSAAYRHATMRVHTAALLFALAALAVGVERTCASQQRLSGRATVTDGDSLEIGDARIRLFGVDAVEGRQACVRNARQWACGEEAARKLRSLIGDRSIACTQRDVDDYGRVVAVCRAGNVDLGAEMVRSGFATAYRRYSNDYVGEENEARAAHRGIWAGEFTTPENYRDEQRDTTRERTAPAQQTQRDGCSIKGNINGEGERIYHTPASPAYRDTEIDTAKGERWFCTEAAARGAGWRAPR